MTTHAGRITWRPVEVPLDGIELRGDLAVPHDASGIVLFAHGSGSSRLSPRNRAVAQTLNAAGHATLLLDLLTSDEERVDARTLEHRFDIPLLAERLSFATVWAYEQPSVRDLALGYFGASTGAAAALVAAAQLGTLVRAVVSRGGRPDLAGTALEKVHAPTLLIVGGADPTVLALNQQALSRLRCPKSLEIVPGATHLFEEHGALERVAHLACAWFDRHLAPAAPGAAAGADAVWGVRDSREEGTC